MSHEVFSDYYLERYVLGELPAEYAEEIRRRISTDPALRAALENIKSSNRDILSLYPAPVMKEAILKRLDDEPSRPAPEERRVSSRLFRRIFYISSALASALVLLILIVPGIKEHFLGILSSVTLRDSLVKGSDQIDLSKTQLLVYRKDENRVELLDDGKQAVKGDLLQLAYVAAKQPYGMIFSIDGGGRITLHFPAERTGGTGLELKKRTSLSNAIELDDAPGFERFFLVTSRTVIDVDDILKRAQNLAREPERARWAGLELPAGMEQVSILIIKGEGS